MKPCFSALALSWTTALLVAACSSTTNPAGDGGTTPPPQPGQPCTTCTGGAPADAKVCPDGTAIGRQCLGRADGTCGYDFPACPGTTPDASPPPSDAGAPDADASPTPVPLGGVCGGRGMPPCASDLFCRFEIAAMCGASDKPGVCAAKPQNCTAQIDPVCGCDGKTYGNACAADKAGISVTAAGVCPLAEGAACGTRGTPGSCGAGLFCKRTIAAACGSFDAPGACAKVPATCAAVRDPVCGCDGNDYPNPCEADKASISVKSSGACP